MSFALWRGVVGMVRPTRRPGTLEELIRMLPEGIGIVPLLLNFKAGSIVEFQKSIPQYEQCVAELAEQGVDLIIPAGAPPFMLLGYEGEAKLIRQWEKKYKTEIATDPQMQVAGLRAMGIKKFIGASYSAVQNEIVQDYMTQAGLRAMSMEPIDVPFDQVAQISNAAALRPYQEAVSQASGSGRHLHPGWWLANDTRGRNAGNRSASSSRTRHDLPGMANSQTPPRARDRAWFRPVARGAAVARRGSFTFARVLVLH